jgi:hypothetical protein
VEARGSLPFFSLRHARVQLQNFSMKDGGRKLTIVAILSSRRMTRDGLCVLLLYARRPGQSHEAMAQSVQRTR